MPEDIPVIDNGLLQADGLRVSYHDQVILDGVDVSIDRAEIVCLIGPNGAGKSTLVRTLLGLIKPQAGTVSRRPGLRIGYMPQHLTLDPIMPLSVRRFLTLTQRATEEAMQEALTEVGSAHLIDAEMVNLSGGERQRVMLARAMLRRPDLLILDEPVQGVDVIGQNELYRMITRLRERHGCAVLMVSHDLHLVMAATDRVICLNRHVCCSGHPEAVCRDPAYLALFGEENLRGLAIYTHHHDHHHDASGEVCSNTGCEHRKGGTPHG